MNMFFSCSRQVNGSLLTYSDSGIFSLLKLTSGLSFDPSLLKDTQLGPGSGPGSAPGSVLGSGWFLLNKKDFSLKY